jgi:hypothetical protein
MVEGGEAALERAMRKADGFSRFAERRFSAHSGRLHRIDRLLEAVIRSASDECLLPTHF